jgi:hypothetical protein
MWKRWNINKRFGKRIVKFLRALPEEERDLVYEIAKLGPLSTEVMKKWLTSESDAEISLRTIHSSFREGVSTEVVKIMIDKGFTDEVASRILVAWGTRANKKYLLGMVEWVAEGDEYARAVELWRKSREPGVIVDDLDCVTR